MGKHTITAIRSGTPVQILPQHRVRQPHEILSMAVVTQYQVAQTAVDYLFEEVCI